MSVRRFRRRRLHVELAALRSGPVGAVCRPLCKKHARARNQREQCRRRYGNAVVVSHLHVWLTQLSSCPALSPDAGVLHIIRRRGLRTPDRFPPPGQDLGRFRTAPARAHWRHTVRARGSAARR